MNKLREYQVQFLDRENALIEYASVLAESLSDATDRARLMGNDLGAANFVITPRPDQELHGLR